MQKHYPLVIVVIAQFFLAGKAGAQYKIGYINLQELIIMMPEYRQAGEALAEYQKALLQNAKEIKDAYEQADSIFIIERHCTGIQSLSCPAGNSLLTVSPRGISRIHTVVKPTNSRIKGAFS